MTIRVVLVGAKGKMGQTVCRTISSQKSLELIGQVHRGDNLASVLDQLTPDVVIDFTLPDCVNKNVNTILDAGVRPVVGATGLTEAQISAIEARCKKQKLGAIIAPNFCLSAILMMRFAREASKYFKDAEIIEYHHPQKKDSPSGTALKTMQMMDADIPIHSVRLPGYFSHQEVIFGGFGETLSIRHDALTREAMMPGLYMACEKVMTLNHCVYGLDALLGT